MRCAIELPNVHDVVLVLENGSLVVVDVEVVWSTKDSHDAGEAGGPRLPVHAVTGVLRLMSSNDGKKVVLFEKCAGGRVREEVGATADVVVNVELRGLFLPEFLEWVSP